MPNVAENKEFGCINFMGRLLREMILLTDAKNTIYIDNTPGFYELSTGKEIFTLKTLGLLYRCIGVSGMNGLDKLLSFEISMLLKKIFKILSKDVN